jgi:DNA polymerase-3 subunit delta
LIEHRPLKEEDWLLKWARTAGGKAFVREFPPQNEGSLARWLQEQAVEMGGKITPPAAGLLARMVVPDKRMAYQELSKLLAYVNYTRPVEPEDVETLSVPVFHETIFALVDSLAVMDGKKASGLLRRFLDDEDPKYVMAMVVRQLRLLLLAREVLDQGGNERDVFTRLKLKHPREAEKIAAQARRFTIDTLEGVFRKLLDIDEAIPTGRIEDEVALETLVAGFTTP